MVATRIIAISTIAFLVGTTSFAIFAMATYPFEGDLPTNRLIGIIATGAIGLTCAFLMYVIMNTHLREVCETQKLDESERTQGATVDVTTLEVAMSQILRNTTKTEPNKRNNLALVVVVALAGLAGVVIGVWVRKNSKR